MIKHNDCIYIVGLGSLLKILAIRSWPPNFYFFFERTTLDECVSIDIAEKYKGIILGGHNQEKEKETRQQHRRVGLGHQHAPNTTPLKYLRLVGLGRRRKPHNTPRDNNTRSDWDVTTLQETTPLKSLHNSLSLSTY